jgi:dolichyl-phosphate beta-glucosyltransferase
MKDAAEESEIVGEGRDSLPRVSIVIPACGGTQPVSRTLNRVAAHLDRVRWTSEVIVVVDGSQEDTLEMVGRWEDRFDSLVIVKHERRRGPGAAARSGLLLTKGRYVILAEAGFAARFEGVDALISSLSAGADVAIASRGLEEPTQERPGGSGRGLAETAFCMASEFLVPTGVKDMFSGLMAFRQRAGRLIAARSKISHAAYAVEWMALAQYLELHVIECPVELARPGGARGLRMLVNFSKLGDLWSVRRRLAGLEYSRPQKAADLMHQTSFVRLDREQLLGAGKAGR